MDDLQHISTIIVDYGGVLAHHYCEPYQSFFAKLLNVSMEESKQLISEKSEQGKLFRIDKISMTEFWDWVIDLSKNEKGKTVDYDILQRMWAKTYILDNRILELLLLIKNRKSIKLGLFTNTDRERYKYMSDTYSLNKHFDIMICSFQNKLIKPSKESFINLISECNVTNPQNILFIDDREKTVNTAIENGITGLVYESYEQLVDFIIENRILNMEDFLV